MARIKLEITQEAKGQTAWGKPETHLSVIQLLHFSSGIPLTCTLLLTKADRAI
jgi:hypothetical protein